MATEPTKLTNKIKIVDSNNIEREYEFPILQEPDATSDYPVSAKYLYLLERKLNHFICRGVTNQIAAANNNVPTSSAVYDKIASLTKINPATVPTGCSFAYYDRLNNRLCYYDVNDVLQIINITGQGPQYNVNVEYDDNNHSLIYGAAQVNLSAAIDYSEIE